MDENRDKFIENLVMGSLGCLFLATAVGIALSVLGFGLWMIRWGIGAL